MISVCIATYNGSAFIQEQLKSVLSQISDTDEVVISDDGSTDDTVLKVNAFCDPRIRWVGIGGRLGVVKNFERALYAAKGNYIFLCDQDDVWLPKKVEQCVDALKESILVVSDCRVVDAQLNEIHPSFFKLRYSGSGIFRNILRNSYLGCCMAFRKELLAYTLPIPALSPMHDMWLGLIAETRGTVSFLTEPLILYRRHDDNASPTTGKSKFSFFKKVKVRIVLSGLLLARLIRNGFKN